MESELNLNPEVEERFLHPGTAKSAVPAVEMTNLMWFAAGEKVQLRRSWILTSKRVEKQRDKLFRSGHFESQLRNSG